LMCMCFNGVWISDGVGKFERLYGPAEVHEGHYTTVVPLPGGGWGAFGTAHEITPVRLTSPARGEPKAEVSYLLDPHNTYPDSDAIRDAVLDSASTNGSQIVVLGTGYSYTNNTVHPIIRRFYLDPDASMIMDAQDVPVPPDFDTLSVDGV